MGRSALLKVGRQLKKLRLNSWTHEKVQNLADMLNPKLRGWINYYGHCRPSELYKLAGLVDKRIVKWLSKKHNIRLYGKAWDKLKALKKESPQLFVHWYMITLRTRRAV
jgi:hypothetical protein